MFLVPPFTGELTNAALILQLNGALLFTVYKMKFNSKKILGAGHLNLFF